MNAPLPPKHVQVIEQPCNGRVHRAGAHSGKQGHTDVPKDDRLPEVTQYYSERKNKRQGKLKLPTMQYNDLFLFGFGVGGVLLHNLLKISSLKKKNTFNASAYFGLE